MILTEKVVCDWESQKYVFKTTKGLYTGNIATATGISNTLSDAEKKLPVIPVAILLKAGVVKKVKASYEEDGKTKFISVLIDGDKIYQPSDLIDISFSFKYTNTSGVEATKSGTITNVVSSLKGSTVY